MTITNLPPPDPNEHALAIREVEALGEAKLMAQTVRPSALAPSVWLYIGLINLCSLVVGVVIGVVWK